MAEQELYASWRAENGPNPFPFAEGSALATDSGMPVPHGAIVDACLYPAGGTGLYLSAVVVTHESVTFVVGGLGSASLCSGSVPLNGGPDVVDLSDRLGRPAGVLVAGEDGLAVFQSWGVGTHEFRRAQSSFAAVACVPTPRAGVAAIALETGEVFAGDVWLVGDDGVVLRREGSTVRVDVVGDPLFRRRLCTPIDLFVTPRFITSVAFVGPNGTFVCEPDEYGDVRIVVNNRLAPDTVLRISSGPDGLVVSAIGEAAGGAT